jgi:hypothetical protein
MPITEIKNYVVAYYAGARNLTGHPYKAIISLRDENNGLLGAAYFHHGDETMPETDTQKATGFISCHYHADDYPHVLDLLRNEKPIYLQFEISAGRVGSIRTNAEPVGEGEISQRVSTAPEVR